MPASRFELPRFILVGLTAAGAPDPSFGAGGIAPLDVQSSCGGCAPAALAPDGSIVITGQTGQFSPATATEPTAGSNLQWVARRLTASGATDPAFGAVPVAGPAGVATGGYSTVVRPSGAIVVLGIRSATGARRADRDRSARSVVQRRAAGDGAGRRSVSDAAALRRIG